MVEDIRAWCLFFLNHFYFSRIHLCLEERSAVDIPHKWLEAVVQSYLVVIWPIFMWGFLFTNSPVWCRSHKWVICAYVYNTKHKERHYHNCILSTSPWLLLEKSFTLKNSTFFIAIWTLYSLFRLNLQPIVCVYIINCSLLQSFQILIILLWNFLTDSLIKLYLSQSIQLDIPVFVSSWREQLL